MNGNVVRGQTVTPNSALIPLPAGDGSGDVVGPASSTDNELPRYDGTTGKLLQGSGLLLSDTSTHILSDSNGNILRLRSVATAVNYLVVTSANSSGNVRIHVDGTSTNVPLRIEALGQQRVIIGASGGHQGLTITDSDVLAPLRITERATAPSTPTSNDIYLDDGTNTASGAPGFRRWTGAAWEDLAGGGDVYTSGSVADNELTRYDGVTGNIIQRGNLIIADPAAGVQDISLRTSTDFALSFSRSGGHGTMFSMVGDDSAVNYPYSSSGATGQVVGMGAAGTDANIDFLIEPQGTGWTKPTRVFILTTEKLQFRDTGIYLNSPADGELDIVADTLTRIGASGASIEVQEDVVPDVTNTVKLGSASLLYQEVHATEYHTNGGELGHSVTSYAAGTAYALTASAAQLNFGTTDPSITIDKAGTYLITGRWQGKYNAATFAANRTTTVKLRRTNNTAADLTNGTVTATTRIITTTTDHFIDQTWCVIYTTTNTDDIVQLFGSIDVVPTAGSLDAVAASIVAVRIA